MTRECTSVSSGSIKLTIGALESHMITCKQVLWETISENLQSHVHLKVSYILDKFSFLPKSTKLFIANSMNWKEKQFKSLVESFDKCHYLSKTFFCVESIFTDKILILFPTILVSDFPFRFKSSQGSYISYLLWL